MGFLWNMRMDPFEAGASTLLGWKPLPSGHMSLLVACGKQELYRPGRNLRQKDPRIPGRRFLAGLGTCRLPSSPAQGDPQVGTTLRGHREVCCNLSRAHSPSATSFLLPAVKLFSFLKFSSQE